MAESVWYCEDGSTTDGDCDQFKYAASSESECEEKSYYYQGYCIPYSEVKWECKSGDASYTEVEGMGATVWCAKQTSKVAAKKCPKGYTENKGTCERTETVKCSAN